MTKYIKLCVDVPEDVYNNMIIKNEYTERDIIAIHNALMDAAVMRSHFLDHERIFESIDVVYPSEDSCIYPEYKGKPYFSIQYEENGEHIVGFGTYNPEVLSRYLIEYFITPIIMMDADKKEDIAKAFQLGLAFGFGAKHDEMDRVINEIKKVTSDCENVPWYMEVLGQGVNLGEDVIKKEEE